MNGYIKLSFFISMFFASISQIFAAGALDHFEVILDKEEAQVEEALDITITAKDKNNETVTDFTGEILVFSESDQNAEFPTDLASNSYTFTEADEGSVKFENGVKFSTQGEQDIYVYDLYNENIIGLATILITKKEENTNTNIEILSPENGITIGENSIKISGSTTKNHEIRIIVNGETDLFTTSDDNGVFEKEVTDLPNGTNTFRAQILNADSEQIGESNTIQVKVNSDAPEFKRISINPSNEIEAESEISIEVVSNAGLSSVQAILNDMILTLEESKDGIYSLTTAAPSTAGEYPIDIILKNEFANETREVAAETLIISAKPELNAASEEPIEEVIEEITEVIADPEYDLTIKNIKLTELKTKSILSWDAPADAESYNIYKKIDGNKVQLIENITEPRYEIEITGEEIKYDDFAIKALGKTSSGETLQGDLSEMTKVKTGPELYFFLALIAILMSSGIFFFRREA